MFSSLFGGGFDMSKFKATLEMAKNRMKLANGKLAQKQIARKKEIAALLKAGKDESARIKTEQIISDDKRMEAHELIELFIDTILARKALIDNKSKECPPELLEAVSTVIYATPRVEIPELPQARGMLVKKFGKEFVEECHHDKNENANVRVVIKLKPETAERILVNSYLKAVAKANNVDWECDEDVEALPPFPQVSPLQYPLPAVGTSFEPVSSYCPPPVVQPVASPNPPGVSYSVPTVTPTGAGPPPPYQEPTQKEPKDAEEDEFPPSAGFELPSPPAHMNKGNGSDGVDPASSDATPDFDDLSARFDALKNRGKPSSGSREEEEDLEARFNALKKR